MQLSFKELMVFKGESNMKLRYLIVAMSATLGLFGAEEKSQACESARSETFRISNETDKEFSLNAQYERYFEPNRPTIRDYDIGPRETRVFSLAVGYQIGDPEIYDLISIEIKKGASTIASIKVTNFLRSLLRTGQAFIAIERTKEDGIRFVVALTEKLKTPPAFSYEKLQVYLEDAPIRRFEKKEKAYAERKAKEAVAGSMPGCARRAKSGSSG